VKGDCSSPPIAHIEKYTIGRYLLVEIPKDTCSKKRNTERYLPVDGEKSNYIGEKYSLEGCSWLRRWINLTFN
jgi:hypothetical protein